MSLIKTVVQRIQRDYFRWQYKKVAQQILDTRPLNKGELPFIAVVDGAKARRRVLPGCGQILRPLPQSRSVSSVVCDPSIDEHDRAVLTRHVPHIELRPADEFTHPSMPRGGTWERLFAISAFVRDNYVVQLDADTLTIQPIPEVLAAITSGTGFVLGEDEGTPLRSLAATRETGLAAGASGRAYPEPVGSRNGHRRPAGRCALRARLLRLHRLPANDARCKTR